MTIVNVTVMDDAMVPAPVVGAVVSLLDTTTLVPVSEVTTDSDGVAGFSVPDDTYEVRVFKTGYGIPVSAIVVDHDEDNGFEITATNLTALPIATDPKVCRCTGTFVDFSNVPIRRVLLRIAAQAESPLQIPKVVNGRLVSAPSMEVHSDELGKVSIDLLRTGEYHVTVAGEEDVIWPIKVPDRSSVNLIDLIHPQPVSVSWDPTEAPGDAVTVSVGETVAIPVSLLLSNFDTVLKGHDTWIQFENSDGDVFNLGYHSSLGMIVIEGLTAGTAEVTVEPQDDLLPRRVPDYSVAYTPLSVTVVP